MDENVYDNLPNVDLGTEVVKLEKRNELLLDHIKVLENDISKLCAEITEMKKIQNNLTTNISELFKTAKVEIERKDRVIADLRREIDDFLFRRQNRTIGIREKRFRDDNETVIEAKRQRTMSRENNPKYNEGDDRSASVSSRKSPDRGSHVHLKRSPQRSRENARKSHEGDDRKRRSVSASSRRSRERDHPANSRRRRSVSSRRSRDRDHPVTSRRRSPDYNRRNQQIRRSRNNSRRPSHGRRRTRSRSVNCDKNRSSNGLRKAVPREIKNEETKEEIKNKKIKEKIKEEEVCLKSEVIEVKVEESLFTESGENYVIVTDNKADEFVANTVKVENNSLKTIDVLSETNNSLPVKRNSGGLRRRRCVVTIID